MIHGKFLVLVLIVILILSPPGAALAHGGGGGEVDGTAASWMIWLIYGQLFLAPFIGLWLASVAYNAWRQPRMHTDVSGG